MGEDGLGMQENLSLSLQGGGKTGGSWHGLRGGGPIRASHQGPHLGGVLQDSPPL